MFLRVGEVGLGSAGGVNVPSKSVEYIEVNLLFPEALGNTLAEALCLSLMFLADFALSRASLRINSLSAAKSETSGDIFAFADFTLLSRVLGLFTGSAIAAMSRS